MTTIPMTKFNITMSSGRVASIDIMRGLTILLMLFVNDLNMDVVPAWLGHTDADHDGMGLADWVFPGFLFIAGIIEQLTPGCKIRVHKVFQPEGDVSASVLARELWRLMSIGG